MLSIITINLNNKAGLAETFASVFCQQAAPFEYIVIDGGSTDGSRELIQQHAGQLTYWISEKDRGIYDAMNKGIAAARGEYFLFLNSGDSLAEPDTLERCQQYQTRYPEADILYADFYQVSEGETAPKQYRYPARFTLKELKKHIPCQQASLVKATLLKETGNFPLRYRIASDYWMYVKSFLLGKKWVHMNFVMARYNTDGLSVSQAQICYTEMNEIWKELVPEPMRRDIDRWDALKKSRWGILWTRLLSKLGIQSS